MSVCRSPSPVAGLIESPIFPPSPSIASPLRGCFSAQGGLSGSPLAGLPPTAGSAVRRTLSASAAAAGDAAAGNTIGFTGGGWQFAAATEAAGGAARFDPAAVNPGALNPTAADDMDAASEAGSSYDSSAGAASGFSSGSSGCTGGVSRRCDLLSARFPAGETGCVAMCRSANQFVKRCRADCITRGQFLALILVYDLLLRNRRRRRRRVAQSLTFAPPSPSGSTGSQEVWHCA